MWARAATLTDAAGYCLASWLGFGCKSLNPELTRVVVGEMTMEFGKNSSFGLGEWLSPNG
jgi:hypothetical protein